MSVTWEVEKLGAEARGPSAGGIRAQVRRPLLGVADQGIFSLTNFVITLIAARLASPARFGDVAVALSVAYMVTIIARGLTAEPMMTKCPRLSGPQLAAAERDALGMALLLGLSSGAAIAALSLIPASVTRDFAWVGLCMPAVLVQDALRYVGFSRRRPGTALISDAAWALVQFGMLGLLAGFHLLSVDWVIICWGAGALAGTVAGALALSVTSIGSARRWFRSTRSYSGWVLPQLGVSQATDQGSIWVIVAFFGSSALGGIRSMQIFVRPVFVFMLAVQALLVPSFTARLIAMGREGLLRQVRHLTLLVGGTALVIMTIMVLLARPLALHVFGPSYVHYSEFLLPFAVGSVFHACGVVPNAGLRALQTGRRILCVQLFASAVSVTAVICAALFSTVYVTAWAIASQGVASAGASWFALATARGVREPPDPANAGVRAESHNPLIDAAAGEPVRVQSRAEPFPVLSGREVAS